MRGFARLFSILTTLEREYGLTSLDAQGRAIFDFVVQSVANGKEPSTDDILATGIASRATTYRRLALLREADLIEARVRGGQTLYGVSSRLAGFSRGFATVVNETDREPAK